MKKFIILFWLSALTVVSCTKENEIETQSKPIQVKVQAVNNDNTVVESNILVIK